MSAIPCQRLFFKISEDIVPSLLLEILFTQDSDLEDLFEVRIPPLNSAVNSLVWALTYHG